MYEFYSSSTNLQGALQIRAETTVPVLEMLHSGSDQPFPSFLAYKANGGLHLNLDLVLLRHHGHFEHAVSLKVWTGHHGVSQQHNPLPDKVKLMQQVMKKAKV